MTPAPSDKTKSDRSHESFRREVPIVMNTIRVAAEQMAETDQVLEDIFRAMKEEEFPTGGVKTYFFLKDPAELGKYVLFQYFTQAGVAAHARGPVFAEKAGPLNTLMSAPYDRTVLVPVFEIGCGEPVTDEVGPSTWRSESWWA